MPAVGVLTVVGVQPERWDVYMEAGMFTGAAVTAGAVALFFVLLTRLTTRPRAFAAAAVLAHAEKVLELERIVAITSPDNAKSIAVLEKIGFQFSRMIRLAADTPELNLFVHNHAWCGQ